MLDPSGSEFKVAHPGRIFEKKSTGKFAVEFFSKISIRLIFIFDRNFFDR